MDSTEVSSAARKAGDHPVVEKGARIGYAMSGVIHFIIGWIALKLAWGIGGGSGDADTSGALKTVASSGGGPLMLGFAVLGFLMLAVALAAAVIVGGETKAVMYTSFAWSSFAIARGASNSDEAKTDDVTAQVMGMPGGRYIVGLVGLVVLGVAGYHVYKGWSKKFLEDLQEHPGDWAVTAGRLGYAGGRGDRVVRRLLLRPRPVRPPLITNAVVQIAPGNCRERSERLRSKGLPPVPGWPVGGLT